MFWGGGGREGEKPGKRKNPQEKPAVKSERAGETPSLTVGPTYPGALTLDRTGSLSAAWFKGVRLRQALGCGRDVLIDLTKITLMSTGM